MNSAQRPRLEEFFLALLWIIGTGAWGYFGYNGYVQNITAGPAFNLAGFILSFFLLCLTVFGLRYALNTFRRIWTTAPGWIETIASLCLGITLVLGFFFTIFSLVISIYHLFMDDITNLIFTWGIAACLGMVALAVYQLMGAIRAFEPFMGWSWQEDDTASRGLKALLRHIHGRNFGPHRSEEYLHGPLILETDSRTILIDEKDTGRQGLEKTLVAHGGFHITTLGFTANGATIFAVSDGGTVHYQSGGRKGTMFPPELKFWEWRNGRVQTAALGEPQTFMTSGYRTPPSLQNYRFLVPASGSKFAWVLPQEIRVGNWGDSTDLQLKLEETLPLNSTGSFTPLAFNPEGSRLAWCTPDGKTRLWNLETNQVQPLRSYPVNTSLTTAGEANPVWGLVFSPDGTRVATLGESGILLQNVYTGWRWFRTLNPQREQLGAFVFNNSGFEMALGLKAAPDAIHFSLSGRRGRNGNQNGPSNAGVAEYLSQQDPLQPDLVPIVRIWDLREDRYIDLPAGNAPIRELAYSSDNRQLAGVDEAGILRLWDIPPEGVTIRPPRLRLQIDLGLTGRKVQVAFSPDIEYMLCATDNRILIWNLARLTQGVVSSQ
jgi:WD40 repeat protein